ncbi:hypothetical protein D9619_011272 [Psilocybe cf. subviscida]|uniref:Uncharacterized protein n=1 Tax=Psilocybe cf. subviscida TaxID=2480587 RepID=A0A8H5BIW0_9AGAR|nr:hypothetical protein D9619_011272 [Psilocybe cf. subviscida]
MPGQHFTASTFSAAHGPLASPPALTYSNDRDGAWHPLCFLPNALAPALPSSTLRPVTPILGLRSLKPGLKPASSWNEALIPTIPRREHQDANSPLLRTVL